MDRPRFAALDVARMLAATAILVHHARGPMGLRYDLVDPYLELAVFVFLSLSGFLVFRPFARGRVPVGAHLTRRLLRIYPAYLVALAATLMLLDPYPHGRELQYALMIQLPETGRPHGVVAVSWSLHVEVVFYLALPLLAWGMAALGGRRRAMSLLMALGALSLVGFLATGPMDGATTARPLIGPLMFWAFLPGMWVAWTLEPSPTVAAALSRPLVLVAGGTLLAVSFLLPRSVPLLPLLLSASGMALMIPGLLALRSMPRLLSPVARAGRALSYPVYLWHVIIIVMVAGAGVRGWLGVGVALGVTLLFGAGSWLFVEQPAIGLSSRLIEWHQVRSRMSAPLRRLPEA